MKKYFLLITLIYLFAPIAHSTGPDYIPVEYIGKLGQQAQIFFKLPPTFSIRKPNSKNIYQRTATAGSKIYSTKIPSRFVKYKGNGIDLTKSLDNWIKNTGLRKQPYGIGDHARFFAVEEVTPTLEDGGYVALHFAAKRDRVTLISKEQAIHEALLKMDDKALVKYVPYPKAISTNEVKPICGPMPSFQLLPKNIISTLFNHFTFTCSNDNSAVSFSSIYDSLMAKTNRALKKCKTESCTKRKIKDCEKKISQLSCEWSPWQGLSVDRRIEMVGSIGNIYAQELNYSPYALTCIASRETGTFEPAIRTKTACQKPYNHTASGLFQMQKGTLRDYVDRGVIFLSKKDSPLSQSKTQQLIRASLGPELSQFLEEDGEGNSRVKKYNKCPKNSTCRKIADKLWDKMANSVHLQVALAGITLTEKKYNLQNYYGNKLVAENVEYEKHINACIRCMHQNKVNQLSTNNCTSLATHGNEKKKNTKEVRQTLHQRLEKRRERNEIKNCKDKKLCGQQE